MIRMNNERGENEWIVAPIFVCDCCRQEITDCARANLLYLPDRPDEQYHVHKGNCDRAFEYRKAVEAGLTYLHFYWQPLDQFLRFLEHNVGLAREAREAFVSIGKRSLRRKEDDVAA